MRNATLIELRGTKVTNLKTGAKPTRRLLWDVAQIAHSNLCHHSPIRLQLATRRPQGVEIAEDRHLPLRKDLS